MDSRHFPSRSTTDNLPSSLSSPPNERPALSSPAAAITDTTTQTVPTVTSGSTMAGTSSSSHLTNLINSDGKNSSNLNETTNMAINSVTSSVTGSKSHVGNGEQQKQQQAPATISSSSDMDTCSTASSDLSYDPHQNPGLLLSSASLNSSTPSIVSIASRSAPSEFNGPPSSSCSTVSEENLSISSQLSLSETKKLTFSAEGSASITQPQASNTASLSQPNVTANQAPSSSTPVLSNKSKGAQFVIKADKDIKSKCDAGFSASVNQPAASTDIGQPVADISSPAERGIKRSRDEMEATSAKSSPAASPQKNKKRCFVCSCKLELAQRTIGKCRCDRVFCALHRLPELHDCEFNHKEDGRREAREKMIKPTRHLGTSYRREDHS